MAFSDMEQNYLLTVAKQSIENGVNTGSHKPIEPGGLPEELIHLNVDQACFVTLNMDDQLRGCIGSLEAIRPLIEDVSQNAFNAAFRDPRFNPVKQVETERLNVGISVLTPPEAMGSFPTIEDLLAQLRPQQDGLIISDGLRRATFLPSVWEQLPDDRLFVQQLMRKAGIHAWSERIHCERYTSFSFKSDWLEI